MSLNSSIELPTRERIIWYFIKSYNRKKKLIKVSYISIKKKVPYKQYGWNRANVINKLHVYYY